MDTHLVDLVTSDEDSSDDEIVEIGAVEGRASSSSKVRTYCSRKLLRLHVFLFRSDFTDSAVFSFPTPCQIHPVCFIRDIVQFEPTIRYVL